MEYTTLEAVRQSLKMDTAETDDDSFLEMLILRASRAIEDHCNRRFIAESATRYFDALEDVDGMTLFLDEDLVSVTTLTNGDGEVLSANAYVFEPRNDSPKYAIRLKAGSGKTWTFQSDSENAISVAGMWGYASSAPHAIQQACIRLVVYWYKLRKNPFYQVGSPESGQVDIVSSIPEDIQTALNPYIKRAFA
jgi:hypothetical protein